ncbi:uncharacterized protein M421DRAFT_90614 [Didymella exigua CBS 183.55]|uniref:Uncharacterized protein n=1 Tax=Didymella exigua CBS 183.55 TaxID=1150837 RepID=A0A6A5RR21_9PLEO|nr:uncharacterized protein M421DRAFT_90614 [Didymella exigua CBS 183.55]KAF1930795.1 hypothetical protein M421DRAFT_90614 [Didymella exigua CBS 183.55]
MICFRQLKVQFYSEIQSTLRRASALRHLSVKLDFGTCPCNSAFKQALIHLTVVSLPAFFDRKNDTMMKTSTAESSHPLRRMALHSFEEELQRDDSLQPFLDFLHVLTKLNVIFVVQCEVVLSIALHELEQCIEIAVTAIVRPSIDIELGVIVNEEAWCGDLLVVDDLPHQVFLSHSVDFHRTVRDFLCDNYREKPALLVREELNPLISLCSVYLALLKGPAIKIFWIPTFYKTIIGLTDELLYYAHELGRRLGDPTVPCLLPILDELDKTNTSFVRRSRGNNHWTDARDLRSAQGLETNEERDTCNFLELVVQARLTGYYQQGRPSTAGLRITSAPYNSNSYAACCTTLSKKKQG